MLDCIAGLPCATDFASFRVGNHSCKSDPGCVLRDTCGTPLMAAAWGNHVDVMRELLARGAKTGLQDMVSYSASCI